MRGTWQSVAAIVASVSLVFSAPATVIRVPEECPTIQAGIDEAADGDTVLVAGGTYTGDGNRDIDVGGKEITVVSESGPEVTIIDCEGTISDQHRGFYFHNGEGANSVVRGFTIQNGYAYGDTWPDDCGGAILCENASPTIVGNTICGNSAGYGGGIYCRGSSAWIVGNTITGNAAANHGGGIRCGDESSAIVVRNRITGNAAERGGGISCWQSTATIMRNAIIGNVASLYGGGIRCWASAPAIDGNVIAGNTASTDGGGISCSWYSFPAIGNNTFTGNRADEGGGLTGAWHCSATVMNSILWGDSAVTASEILLDSMSSISITYSDVQGGWPGEGNIDADPEFVLAEKGDHRLLWGSPCIDSGNPDSLDPDGTRRDVGAYYFDQDDYLTLYLTADTTRVSPGGTLGVTYTVINRWAQPEPLWVLTEAILPNGNPFPVMGPDQYALPANHTEQRHLNHIVPGAAPFGLYGYGSRIGMPPSTLYDEDSFTFTVVEQ